MKVDLASQTKAQAGDRTYPPAQPQHPKFSEGLDTAREHTRTANGGAMASYTSNLLDLIRLEMPLIVSGSRLPRQRSCPIKAVGRVRFSGKR
jgi:hypothetical protein